MLITSSSSFNKINKPLELKKVQFSTSFTAKDTFIKSNTTPSISFLGLTRTIGKKIFETYEELIDLVESKPNANGNIGNLPKEWIDKIPEDKRRESILYLYGTFNALSLSLRHSCKDLDKESKCLTEAFQTVGILKEGETATIDANKSLYGGFGRIFSLKLSNNPDMIYAIKLFHSAGESNVDQENENGNVIEMNRGMYFRKNIDKTSELIKDHGKKSNRPKFFFANALNGYMVTQYINVSLPNGNTVDLNDYGLIAKDDDREDNKSIKGYFYEYGGLKSVSILTNNKTARWAYHQIKKTPADQRAARWNEIYENDKVPNKQDILIGLAIAVQLLPDQSNQDELFKKILVKNNSDLAKKAINESFTKHSSLKGLSVIEEPLSESQIEDLLFNVEDFQPKERLDLFKKVLKMGNKEHLYQILFLLNMLPEEDRLTICLEIIKVCPALSRAVVNQMELIPQKDHLELFLNLIINNDSKYQSLLLDKIDLLTPGQKQEWLNAISDPQYDNIDKIYKDKLSI